MTHLKYPVLASLALLGACNYEVTLWSSGGGGDPTFDATKIGDLVKQIARANLGEPSAVRCPPKMQFVPRDRYTCQFDFEGSTYDVDVRHGVFLSADAHLHELAVGGEPLEAHIESTMRGHVDGPFEVDCHGVVVTRAKPQVVCMVDGDEGVLVTLRGDQLNFNLMEMKSLPW
ncbi:MAG TPA: DUF4333 domain-containing protein [Kofleriaceae bacterium]|nr:DUF4333 domain-containing protein [Kofleriaceae bacterium]